MLATAALLVPAAAAPASAQQPPPDPSIIGIVDGILDTEFGEAYEEEIAKALEKARQQGRSGSHLKINLVDSGSAGIDGGGSCRWTVETDLQARYRPDTSELERVSGAPSATFSCRGGEVRPVAHRATLIQTVDGESRATIDRSRCADQQGCPAIQLAGPYSCAGRTCAGNHQIVLRHRHTLPAGEAWVRVPEGCETSGDGATLTCRSAGEAVLLPATGAGIRITG